MSSLLRRIVPLSLLAAVNCSSRSVMPESTAPSAVTPFVGTWSGTVNLILNGNAALTMTIAAESSRLAGNWAMKYSNGNPEAEGTLTGGVSADGASMSVDLISAGANCPPVVSGTIDPAGTRMTGKYDASIVCGTGVVTPLTLAKQ